jgi:hypothetical protein
VLHVLLTSAQGGERSASRSGRFAPYSYFIRRWVSCRVRLDTMVERTVVASAGLQVPVFRPTVSHFAEDTPSHIFLNL